MSKIIYRGKKAAAPQDAAEEESLPLSSVETQSDNTQSAPPPEEKTAESAEANSSFDVSEEISADADGQSAQEEKPARPKTERKVARTRAAKPKETPVESEKPAEEEKQAEEQTAASPAEEEVAVASVQALEDEA